MDKRNYVVIARFDDEMDKKIVNLREQLVDAGYTVPEWPPHITIAAYENFDEKLLCEWTSDFSSKQKRMKIALLSMSILPPGGEHTETAVLCLDPAHSKTFVDFYYDFHEKYEEYCTGIGWFNSISHGNPVIHATIGIIKVKELQKAMELVFSSGVFGYAEITALEVYTYPMKLIERFELKRQGE